MTPRRVVFAIAAFAVACPLFAQGARGKAELKTPAGLITIDYGQPTSTRDRVSELQDIWRMGKDQATVIKTPVDLVFGAKKVAKGSYSLFLKRAGEAGYELLFNSQTGQWGTEHDASRDVAAIPLKKETLPKLVETFMIGLRPAPGGGRFEMSWGTTKLSADFQFGK